MSKDSVTREDDEFARARDAELMALKPEHLWPTITKAWLGRRRDPGLWTAIAGMVDCLGDNLNRRQKRRTRPTDGPAGA